MRRVKFYFVALIAFLLTIVALKSEAALQPGTIAPGDTTIGPGRTITFRVTAPSGGTTYTYSWERSSNGVNWAAITGATGETYTTTALTTSVYFRRRVGSPTFGYAWSNICKVNVIGVSISPSLSMTTVVRPNELPPSLSSLGRGGVDYEYQWEKKENISGIWQNWGTINGANTSTYQPPTLRYTTWFRVTVTSNGVSARSDSTRFLPIRPGLLTAGKTTINYNSNTSLSVTNATIGEGIGFRWFRKGGADTVFRPVALLGADSTYTSQLQTGTVSYYFQAGFNGVYANSNIVTVNVFPRLLGGARQSSSYITVNYNASPGLLTIAAPSGGAVDSGYVYQWQKSVLPSTTDFIDIAGATTASYNPGNMTAGAVFRRKVINNGAEAYNSGGNITVGVNGTSLTGGLIFPALYTVNSGTVPPSMALTLVQGGTGTRTYQWQLSSDQEVWSNIAGATSLRYTPATAISADTYYRVQVTSNGENAYSLTAAVLMEKPTLLGANPSPEQNFIVTYIPKVSGITNPDSISLQNISAVQQTIQYFDGLGRPLQTVNVKGSPDANKDLVQPLVYDAFGRETLKYLPYSSASNNGSYKSDALNNVMNFYNPPGSNEPQLPSSIARNQFPYAETGFEQSPLNRVMEQGAPGDNWQLTGKAGAASPGHTVKFIYTTNNESDRKAALYEAVINPDGSRTLSRNPNQPDYSANELYVTISKDENWKAAFGRGGTSEEYKDKEGRIVLKRIFLSDTEPLSTYYVYDDLGNLSFVLPPGAKADLALPDASIQRLLCYQYSYDERNRLIAKRIPGKDWEYMLYNRLDQVVLTQDGNQRLSNQWSITNYDALGRIAITGVWNAPSNYSLTQLRDSVYASAQWVSRDSTNNITLNPNGYVVGTFPRVFNSHVINFYDSYENLNPSIIPSNFVLSAEHSARGLLTATTKIVLDKPQDRLASVYYYDEEGRLSNTFAQHYLGGKVASMNYEQQLIAYSFTGEVVSKARQVIGVPGIPALNLVDDYLYDHMGRKVQTWKQVSSGKKVMLSKLDYNDLGQLIKKHLHKLSSTGDYLKTVGYTYNERGWLTSAIDDHNQYNQELAYNKTDGVTEPNWNGNISQMSYLVSSLTVPSVKSFRYNYDRLNRLTHADANGNALDERISYDVMGNIKTLKRGSAGNDTLHYTYSGNQLTSVNGYSPRSYTYDANGNALTDGQGKAIRYNIFNLPQTVSQKDNPASLLSAYTYDATGDKLRNVASDGVWDYMGGLVFKNGELQFIQTDEGRIDYNNGVYNYEYNLTDHLGNVRASFDVYNNAARLIQEDEYYSFGLRRPVKDNANNNRYLYNGKEVQTDLANQYDYGARFYDPVIARWTSVDPLADHPDQLDKSPYAYAWNNPISNVDPDGRFVFVIPLVYYAAAEAVVLAGGIYAAYRAGQHIASHKSQNGTIVSKAPSHEAPKIIPARKDAEPGSRAGKGFTPKEKGKVIDANKQKNDGKTVCENCKVETTKPEKSQKGVTPPNTDTNVDHIEPKSKGGSGTAENGQVLCRGCNLDKSDKVPEKKKPQ